MIFLNTLGITNIESWSLNSNAGLILQVLALDEVRILKFKGLMYFIVSNDSFEDENEVEDDISIVEVNHEYRKVLPSELDKYEFIIPEHQNIGSMHVVKFHGSSVIELVCREVDINEQ